MPEFSESDIRRIARAVRDYERREKGRTPPRGDTAPRSAQVEVVRVTSTTLTSGRYPGKIEVAAADAASDSDLADCWVVDVNGGTLATGKYPARRVPDANGRPVFRAGASGSSSGTSPSPGDTSNCWPIYTATVDSDQNDYNPSANLWWKLSRGTTPGNVNITGIAAGGDGCPLLITHGGSGAPGTNTITLKCSSTASSAANRILDPDGGTTDFVLSPGRSVWLRYDVNSSRWRIFEVADTSATQVGVVNLSKQTMGAGEKDFQDKVAVGSTGALTNSALDVRGYTYAYFAGILSFGGGNSPSSENDGGQLSWTSGTLTITLAVPSASYTSGRVGGFAIAASGKRAYIRHKTATNVCYSFLNDDTSTFTDGIDASVTLAKLTSPAGSNGSMTVKGGIITAYTPPT